MQSLSSMIFFTNPDSSVNTRPYPVGESKLADKKVTLALDSLWNFKSELSVSSFSSGTSPFNTRSSPLNPFNLGFNCWIACPVPFWGCWRTKSKFWWFFRESSTKLDWCPTTINLRFGLSPWVEDKTLSISDFPAKGWRTWGNLLFSRVPFPAA